MAKKAEPKVKKALPPKAAAKLKKGALPAAPVLSAPIQAKCEKFGSADSGVSFKSLLQKLLLTKGLSDVDQDKALDSLKKHGGLLNKARAELVGGA